MSALLPQKSQYTRIQILYIIEEFPYIIEKICTLHYLARTGIGPLYWSGILGILHTVSYICENSGEQETKLHFPLLFLLIMDSME